MKILFTCICLFLSSLTFADKVEWEYTSIDNNNKSAIKKNEKSKNKKIQKASENIIHQLQKGINPKTPKSFVILLKTMESDDKFAYDLTRAIGSQNKRKVDTLLTEVTKTKMSIDYLNSGSDSDILSFKICASINGVLRCFPSQRNSMDCPKF